MAGFTVSLNLNALLFNAEKELEIVDNTYLSSPLKDLEVNFSAVGMPKQIVFKNAGMTVTSSWDSAGPLINIEVANDFDIGGVNYSSLLSHVEPKYHTQPKESLPHFDSLKDVPRTGHLYKIEIPKSNDVFTLNLFLPIWSSDMRNRKSSDHRETPVHISINNHNMRKTEV